jgi:hypothetical protein
MTGEKSMTERDGAGRAACPFGAHVQHSSGGGAAAALSKQLHMRAFIST